MNTINKEMDVPTVWQEGEIIRLYKGKGTKGKCSNERGITLSSNFGKVYERIINERVIKNVNLSESQAGGRKGTATVAWLTGIMHVLYKQGLTDNHWTLVRKLNENLTAKVQTKYGMTRTITIKDSIRQGGVLSTTMYGLLMDEISKEIKKENIGIKTTEEAERKGSLLWVDDVLLITTEGEDLQKSLNITNETSDKYHVEYGEPKSNVLKVKHTRKKKEENFYIGDQQLKEADKYKYLGHLQNSKNNNNDHMQMTKGKTEAAYQKMMALTGGSDFMQIEMETIWTVLEACIIPIIIYGGEAWEMTTQNFKTANMLLDNILKRILKTPKGTPREALYIETGILDPKTLIMKNRITMESRIKKGDNETMKEILSIQNEGSWATQNNKIKEKLEITEVDMNQSKNVPKRITKEKISAYFKEELTANAHDKSKMKYYFEGKQEWKIRNRANYMNKLTRNQASTIFKARTRMLKVKANYKNGNKDINCRACGKYEETQNHILEECEIINKDESPIKKEIIFTECATELKKVAISINKKMELLEKIGQKSTSS